MAGTSTEQAGSGDAHWVFTHLGIEYGPLTDEQLFDAVDRGLLTPQHELRRSDMDAAVMASEIDGLFDE